MNSTTKKLVTTGSNFFQAYFYNDSKKPFFIYGALHTRLSTGHYTHDCLRGITHTNVYNIAADGNKG